MPPLRSLPPATVTGRCRLAVLAAALLATAVKLALAVTTYGSLDVRYFVEFAQGVRDFGPIGVYGHEFTEQYNHPPLVGWGLLAAGWLADHHVAGFPTLIRLPSIMADPVTALLVFELVRRQRGAGTAAVAGGLVAVSPVLAAVSGFHGNTDPVFVMFTVLSVYLLAVRRRALPAGAAIALAISVKLVPVVLVPVLLTAVARAGRRQLATFAAGGTAVFLVLWLPVLLTRWSGFRADVLGYAGVATRSPWGIIRIADLLGAPAGVHELLAGPGRFAVLLVCATVPVLVLLRRPTALPAAAGLGLVLFLLLCPTFGMQYLAWPLAGAYLVGTVGATAYNVLAGGLAVAVYDYWAGAHPWHWEYAHPREFRPVDHVLAGLTWLALGWVALTGLGMLRPARTEASEASEAPSPRQLDFAGAEHDGRSGPPS